MLASSILVVLLLRAEAIPLGPPQCDKNPLRLKNGSVCEGVFRGTVVGVGRRSLTVEGAGGTLSVRPDRLYGRQHFVAWGPLSWGMPVADEWPVSHLLQHVQVGDRVRVFYGRLYGKLVTVSVLVERRPGGTIPPIFTDNPDPRGSGLQKWLQAQQDAGEPIPRVHLTPVERKGRWVGIQPFWRRLPLWIPTK